MVCVEKKKINKFIHFQWVVSLLSHCFHKLWIIEIRKYEGLNRGLNLIITAFFKNSSIFSHSPIASPLRDLKDQGEMLEKFQRKTLCQDFESALPGKKDRAVIRESFPTS